MSRSWKWIVTVASAIALIVAVAVARHAILFQGGYTMMNNARGYGMHMPMMYGGNMMGLSMMVVIWLVLLGLLVLIPLAIIWLIRSITTPKLPLP
ncbi:MAG: hypothetical protein U0V48_08165 [Anaerolineales bacterium]